MRRLMELPRPWPRTLTVGGLPGTGTTTACQTLQELLGLRYVYAGQIFRDMANEHGMNLERFGAYAEQHPEIDRSLDDRQVRLLREGPLLLEGRLAGYFAHRERIPAFKAWFTCDPYVRADRVVKREGGDREARMEEMRRREASERKRYLEFYGYDMSDLSVYDLVLDTSELSPKAVVGAVIRGYEVAARSRPWWRFWRRA